MSRTRLPVLDASQRQRIINTLTTDRLSKYLRVVNNDHHQVLKLYSLNNAISAALFLDIHYLEVTLRNKFHAELTTTYGADWFHNQAFLALQNPRTRGILLKAERDAGKRWLAGTPLPPGKVVAELTFGFWLNLTDKGLEHSLWTPCLHKAFSNAKTPRRQDAKTPRRSTVNSELEKIRQLRNRIAHHEAIFLMDLVALHKTLRDVTRLLCHDVAHLMIITSTVRSKVGELSTYRRRKGF